MRSSFLYAQLTEEKQLLCNPFARRECVVTHSFLYATIKEQEDLMMLEMELKARLNDKSKLRQKLILEGCQWLPAIVQEDVIYIKKDITQKINIPVFRIRKIDNKTILTLKVQEADLNTAKELELGVSDDKTMHQMLQTIGFEAKVEVKKQRTETEYKGCTICIDEVEQLGDFVEIEQLGTEEADSKKVYMEMLCILKELGITSADLVEEKYFEMIQKLEG